jgi:hypothetical protein
MRIALALLVALSACDLDRTVGLSTDPTKTSEQDRALRFARRDTVDLLLVIDDSGSMTPKQHKLQLAIPQLVAPLLNGSPTLDLHIGVVTTDLGAPGITCGANRGGKLQPVGAGSSGCLGPTGTSYLSVSTNGTNIPVGHDVVETIGCMAQVGDHGCGFEMPLEAAYRALSGGVLENIGFLRDEAILAVLFLTDEDDCSVDDATSDLFSANTALYGPLSSYRCTRFGTRCDGLFPLPAAPVASFASCQPAKREDGGRLADLAKYQAFFGNDNLHGGLKASPADVVLAAVRAPPQPFGTEIGETPDVCGQGVSSCTQLSHSCVAIDDGTFTGDPAVRLDALVSALGGLTRSICEGSYAPFANDLGTRIRTATTGVGCIPGAVANPSAPDCTISASGVAVPRCGAGTNPCWRVQSSDACPEQLDPRTGALQRLQIVFDGVVTDEQGTCKILTAS